MVDKKPNVKQSGELPWQSRCDVLDSGIKALLINGGQSNKAGMTKHRCSAIIIPVRRLWSNGNGRSGPLHCHLELSQWRHRGSDAHGASAASW